MQSRKRTNNVAVVGGVGFDMPVAHARANPQLMKRALIALVLLLVAALVLWRLRPVRETPSSSNVSPVGPAGTPSRSGGAGPQKSSASGVASADEASHLADTLNSPTTDIRSDLRVVAEVIDAFRTNFPREGNPVGDNAEITAALTGHNKLQLALIPPKHPAINRNGELCDRWGTPFFFHAESGTRMEIRSAGPDRKLWNDDDVVYTP